MVLRPRVTKIDGLWLPGLLLSAWLLSHGSLLMIAGGALILLGAPILLRAPWLIYPLFAAALPFASSFKIGSISGSELMLAAALCLWFANGVRQRTLRLSFSPPVLVVLLYALFLFAALLNASNFAEAIAEVLKWAEVAVTILLVQAGMPGKQRPWLVFGLLIGASLQGIFGLYQFIFRIGPDWFLFLGRYMRAYGSFGQPNPYAGYLGLTLPVAASFALFGLEKIKDWKSAAWNASPLLWGLIGIGSTALIGMGILLSWSRGGWLGALAGLAVVFFFRSRRTLLAGALLFLLLLCLLLAGSVSPTIVPDAIRSRLADLPSYFGLSDVLSQPVTDENFAVVERIAHWAAALRMWDRSPWIGVGPGNYATVYPAVKIAGWDEALGHAHNIYLNLLAETGILGFICYLGLWLVIGVWLIQQFRQTTRRNAAWDRALLLGILGVMAHLAVHNLFDNLYVQGIYLHLALWIGAIASRSDGALV